MALLLFYAQDYSNIELVICFKIFSDVMKEMEGAVTEAGAFCENFAKYVNKFCFNNTYYLFETFKNLMQEIPRQKNARIC